MAKRSAGFLIYRQGKRGVEVLLVHPGGPFWAERDAGAWSIPKGEAEPDEDLLRRAKIELKEETGLTVEGPFHALDPVKQTTKTVYAWAVRGVDLPPCGPSNTFTMEWPPRSGRMQEFPEVDRTAWVDLSAARRKLIKGQAGLIDQLENLLANGVLEV
jgi:predicted NUDIX family NTP pyrophosphohydrolase